MQTVKSFADNASVSTRTVQRWIDKFNDQHSTTHGTGLNSEIDNDLLSFLQQKANKSSPVAVSITDTNEQPPSRVITPTIKERPSEAKKTKFIESFTLGRTLQIIALLSLGIVASYGVYEFSTHFVKNNVFALIEAAAFELTYVGLAFSHGLPVKVQAYAQRVSLGAMIISALFNTFANALNMDPDLSAKLSPFLFWSVAILRGVPVPVLAYFMADLIIHQKK